MSSLVIHCGDQRECSESGLVCNSRVAYDVKPEAWYRAALVCHMPFRAPYPALSEARRKGLTYMDPLPAVRGINLERVPHYLCKRCAAGLNKIDRAFQAKAKKQFRARAKLERPWNFLEKTSRFSGHWEALRATREEEGRADAWIAR